MSDECVTVTVGSFVADGTTADGDGIVWTVEGIDGWFDSASLRVEKQATLPFGEVVTYVRENGRPISLALVASAAGGLPLGDLLCFTAPESIAVPFKCVYQEVVLEVADPNLTLHAAVRRVGPIKSSVVGAATAMRFLIPLFAEDPFRYDASDNPFD